MNDGRREKSIKCYGAQSGIKFYAAGAAYRNGMGG